MLGWIARIGDAFRQRNEIAEMVQENAGSGESGSDAGKPSLVDETPVDQLPDYDTPRNANIERNEAILAGEQKGLRRLEAAMIFGLARAQVRAADEQAGETNLRLDEQAKAQVANKIDSANRQGLQAIQQPNPTADRIAAKLESYGASSCAAPAKESSQDLGAEL